MEMTNGGKSKVMVLNGEEGLTCEVYVDNWTKWVDERIDEGVLRLFGHVERMENRGLLRESM